MATLPQLNLTESSLGLVQPSPVSSEKDEGVALHHDDYVNRNGVSKEESRQQPLPPQHPLHQLKSANSYNISPEMFERIYLQPENQVKGELRKTFGNPTPLGLLGYLLSLSPLACDLMGWRGGGGGGGAYIGVYYFIGGVLMLLSGILEFFLGNTFPFVVFTSFGGFFLSLGATFTPALDAGGTFVTSLNGTLHAPPTVPSATLANPLFDTSYGFFMLFMALLSMIYLILALRTNIVFVIIFLGLFMTFAFLTGTHWQRSTNNIILANRLQVASGAWGFVACAAGWYIFVSQMLTALDFPFSLPVGDLSHLIKGGTELEAERAKGPSYPVLSV